MEIMLAVESSVFRLAIAGGVVLAVAAFARPSHPHHHHSAVHQHRLTLHAPIDPREFYVTPFAEGSVNIMRDDEHLVPLVMRATTHYVDGCDWMGIDTLVPIDAHQYSYSYDERILSCEEGAIPAHKTPRTGYVVVDESPFGSDACDQK